MTISDQLSAGIRRTINWVLETEIQIWQRSFYLLPLCWYPIPDAHLYDIPLLQCDQPIILSQIYTIPGFYMSQAIESIKAGKHFIPNETGGFFFRKTPSDFGLKPHMFYRQSMIFINYLVELNEADFRRFLLSVEEGEPVARALKKEYGKTLETLWREFLRSI